jgi:aldehyde:ferredoxin oxidoreductase
MYTPELVSQALATVGFKFSLVELDQLGAETLRQKYDYKQREGFEFSSLRLPARIFETPAPAGTFDEAFMREAIRNYADKL